MKNYFPWEEFNLNWIDWEIANLMLFEYWKTHDISWYLCDKTKKWPSVYEILKQAKWRNIKQKDIDFSDYDEYVKMKSSDLYYFDWDIDQNFNIDEFQEYVIDNADIIQQEIKDKLNKH